MFINAVLCNSETWYGITKDERDKLENMDKILIRRILDGHSKTPTEALYLETGSIPLRFIIQARRLNFLKYILSRKDSEMLLKFFWAQNENELKNDWTRTVKDDLEEFDIFMTFEEIAETIKEKFKQLVKDACKQRALEYLKEEANKKKKMSQLKYHDLNLQNYFVNNNITEKAAKLLFITRINMLDLKINFASAERRILLEDEMVCSLCDSGEEEDLRHIFQCERHRIKIPEMSNTIVSCEDIYSSNLEKIKSASAILEKIVKKRELLKDS